MLKKILVAAIVAVSLTFATVAPAHASTRTTANTLKSQKAVNLVLKALGEEAKWTTRGCVFHTSVKSALSYAKKGKAIPLKIATTAMKQINKTGKGTCKATVVIAATAAHLQVTYLYSGKVYIKQTQKRYRAKWYHTHKTIEVSRWVGPTKATATKKYHYKI